MLDADLKLGTFKASTLHLHNWVKFFYEVAFWQDKYLDNYLYLYLAQTLFGLYQTNPTTHPTTHYMLKVR